MIKLHFPADKGWVYNEDTKEHDIVLLELESELTFNEYVQPACLASEPAKQGDEVFVSGWGSIAFSKSHYARYCIP